MLSAERAKAHQFIPETDELFAKDRERERKERERIAGRLGVPPGKMTDKAMEEGRQRQWAEEAHRQMPPDCPREYGSDSSGSCGEATPTPPGLSFTPPITQCDGWE